MSKSFNLPHYKTVVYDFNAATGYYTKSNKQPEKTAIMRLPYELRRTPTQSEKIKCNANELLVSREKSKKENYKFITGIQTTLFKNWYLGNDFQMLLGQKVISIILFHFKDDNSRLELYYFSKYDKGSTDLRLRFANQSIPYLITAVEQTKKEIINPL